MRSRSKQPDLKNIIIVILSVLVLGEALFILRLYFKEKPKPQLPEEISQVAEETTEQIAGYIAIIIDDWGYNIRHCENLAGIDDPLTISILPDLDHSTDIAHCADRYKKEIILHLPLEPHESFERYPDDYVIKTTMSEKDIQDILNKALASVPFAVGINNHMGSRATEDEALMRLIFSILKKERLFFIDSLVTNQSVCQRLAYQVQLPFIARDIFLDNENDSSYIKGQFAKLARLAKKRGYAIGIGHDRTLSLRVIKEEIESLKKQGFVFVTVGEIIKSHAHTRN